MPSDVFISYSRKDSVLAVDLAERLRVSGLSVWIDQHGLEAAVQWTKEIVDAVESCQAFVLLLSQHSLASKNVMRELSIASESGVTIVPIELEPITLPSEFKYQLAGIQRTQLSDFDSIIRSLSKLGIGPATAGVTTDRSVPKLVSPPPPVDTRKSLMVMPFEDLSPTQDNGWFADGLTGELIHSLSHVKSLRLIDLRTAMEYKGFRGKTNEIGRDMNVRYFLEGQVRKFGDQIKISVSLLDVTEGEHLWVDSHKGVFADIFEIQEDVAKKVTEGLKVVLGGDEEKRIAERGTKNVEAYEYYMRAVELSDLQTQEGYGKSNVLLDRAIGLDCSYVDAIYVKAFNLCQMYERYGREQAYIEESEREALNVKKLRPESGQTNGLLSRLYLLQGRVAEAEKEALAGVANAPESAFSHASLGHFYLTVNRYEEAIIPTKEAVRLEPDNRFHLWNLVNALFRSGKKEECREYAATAVPVFERWLRMHPEDVAMMTLLPTLMYYAGLEGDSRKALARAEATGNLDAFSQWNVGALYAQLGNLEESLAALGKSVEMGFSQPEALTRAFFDPLRDRAEFQELAMRITARSAAKPQMA